MDRKQIVEWFAEHEFGDDLVSLTDEQRDVCEEYANQIIALDPEPTKMCDEGVIKDLEILSELVMKHPRKTTKEWIDTYIEIQREKVSTPAIEPLTEEEMRETVAEAEFDICAVCNSLGTKWGHLKNPEARAAFYLKASHLIEHIAEAQRLKRGKG